MRRVFAGSGFGALDVGALDRSIALVRDQWLRYADEVGNEPVAGVDDFVAQMEAVAREAASSELQAGQTSQATFLKGINAIPVYGSVAGPIFEKVIAVSNAIAPDHDWRYDATYTEQAKDAFAKRAAQGWPLIPIPTAQSSEGMSPYALAANQKANLDAFRKILRDAPARAETLRAIWTRFVRNVRDRDVGFLASFAAGVTLEGGPSYRGGIEPAQLDPYASEVWGDWTVFFATVAAVSNGADIHDVTRGAMARVFSEVLEPRQVADGLWTHVSRVPDIAYGSDAFDAVAMWSLRAEIARIALDEASKAASRNFESFRRGDVAAFNGGYGLADASAFLPQNVSSSYAKQNLSDFAYVPDAAALGVEVATQPAAVSAASSFSAGEAVFAGLSFAGLGAVAWWVFKRMVL